MDYGITPQGFVKKTYQEILNEILRDYETVFPGFKRHESNALYIQAQAAANRLEQLWNVMEAVYYSKFVITAYGDGLTMRVIDIIGKRLDPRYAQGFCKVSANRGTQIPQGTLLKRANRNLQYRTIKDYVVESDKEPTTIEVQCTTAGTQGNAPIGSITSFVESLVGIKSVYNDSAIIGGSEQETDDELKARYYDSLQDTRGSNIPAINAKLRSLGLDSFRVRENRTKTEVMVGGVLMPPHSIAATVFGGVDEEIAEALFNTKAGGIDMKGDKKVVVTSEDGVPYDILFTKATGTSVYIKLEIRVGYAFLGPFEQQLKTQMMDYINKLSIDEVLEYDLLLARGFDGIPGVTSISLYVDTKEKPVGREDLIPNTNEKFVISEENIKISITRG